MGVTMRESMVWKLAVCGVRVQVNAGQLDQAIATFEQVSRP